MVQTRSLAADKRSLPNVSKKEFTLEEPEKFKLLLVTCPTVFPYMPSIQRRKAHQKTLRNVSFHTIYSKSFRTAVKHVFLIRVAAFACRVHTPRWTVASQERGIRILVCRRHRTNSNRGGDPFLLYGRADS